METVFCKTDLRRLFVDAMGPMAALIAGRSTAVQPEIPVFPFDAMFFLLAPTISGEKKSPNQILDPGIGYSLYLHFFCETSIKQKLREQLSRLHY